MCTYTAIKFALLLLVFLQSTLVEALIGVDECQVTPVIHLLRYQGCLPKPIPSFACTGRCSSYLQVNIKQLFDI